MSTRVPVRWAEGIEQLGFNAVATHVCVVLLADGRIVRQEIPEGFNGHNIPPWRLKATGAEKFDKAAQGLTEVDVAKRAFFGRIVGGSKRLGV